MKFLIGLKFLFSFPLSESGESRTEEGIEKGFDNYISPTYLVLHVL